jgi:hypothetical protein
MNNVNGIQTGEGKMAKVNFEYASGILEGFCPKTGNDFSWFKGDSRVDVSNEGTDIAELAVPEGFTVVQVKKLIRESFYV